jgi:ADP-ribosylglycohydrolase
MRREAEEALLDRFRGALLGLALGDALGAPYEFSRPPFEVSGDFRRGYFGTDPGHPTDDTALALACAGALLDPEGLARGYVRRLLEWAAGAPPDIGGQTRRAVAAWRLGRPPAADEAAQGNGSLMAVAPVALRYAFDTARAAEQATLFAGLTHPSAATAACNRQFVTRLAAVLRGDPGPPSDLPEGVAGRDPAGAHMGWCWRTLHQAERALAATAHPATPGPGSGPDPFAALVAVIAGGGDTDTNGAVAGALLGAAHGAGVWPYRLVDALAVREQAEDLAPRLLDAALAGAPTIRPA